MWMRVGLNSSDGVPSSAKYVGSDESYSVREIVGWGRPGAD